MNKRLSSILWGIAFIVVGVGIAGNIFNLWDFRLFFRGWWTLFIIVPCAISMVDNGVNSGNAIGLIIGVLLLIDAQLSMHVAWKLVFPFILIFIGCKILLRGHFHSKSPNNGEPYDINVDSKNNGGYLNVVAIFWGSEKRVINQNVTGADCVAIFGGIDLDLRNAIITEDITIESVNIFGGTDIFIPNNINVKINSLPIFGGVDDKSYHPYIEGAPTIQINGTCVFGGIDIK